MFYRQKIILSIIDEFGGSIGITKLQKLLFLFSQKQNGPAFHFVPYKFGCYSFQAKRDVEKLGEGDVIRIRENDIRLIKKDGPQRQLLNDEDRSLVLNLKREFGHFTTADLIKYTYKNHPYFAINSTIAEKILSIENWEDVQNTKVVKSESAILTIGYEGLTLEGYLNKLIESDIRCLCDVRKNPLSRKFGFSKKMLQKACNGVNIAYVHIPELGIESVKRKTLRSIRDYRELFDDYSASTLKENTKAIDRILELKREFGRIALTCFESHHTMCHRGCITQYIESNYLSEEPIEHL